ncbi:MAG: leucine-rich repeat protein, partial [Spirochaetales bacterium]|nr:leucine-rich repeat protein [Spirochaetales bacterium]
MMKKIISCVLLFLVCVIGLNAQDMPADLKNCNDIVAYANDVYQQIKTIKDDCNKSMEDELAAANSSYQRKVTAIIRGAQESPADFEQRWRAEKSDYAAALESENSRIHQKYDKLIADSTVELTPKFEACKNNTWSIPCNNVRLAFTQYNAKEQRYYFNLGDSDDTEVFYEWYISAAAKDPQAQKELYQKINQYVKSKGYFGYMVYGIVWDETEEKFVKKLKSAGVKQKDTRETASVVNVKVCLPRCAAPYGTAILSSVDELATLMSVLTNADKAYNIRITTLKPSWTAIADALNTKPGAKVNLDLSQCIDTNPAADKPFEQCSNLVSVVTPLVVNNGLFEGCVALSNAAFPEGASAIGDRAFFGCAGLTTVTLPESLKSIGDEAFGGCVGLTAMILPESVTEIGNGAFIGCFGITEPLYNATVFAYMPTNFEGEYSIPNGIKAVAGSSFYMCKDLTNVIIPKSVRSIGNNAFKFCEKLTKPVFNSYVFAYMPATYKGDYTVQRGVKIIAGGAFANCVGLTAINLPNSLMTVGDGAFYGCSELTNVLIPNSLLYIGDDAFRNCDELLTVKIGIYVKSIGKSAFAECGLLLSVALPDSVTSIGDEIFLDCPNLRDVTIPNGVQHIGERSFYKCVGMTNITIGNDVVSIGESAFGYCNSLPDVIIPNSVTSIENGAFSNCEKLKTLSVHAVEPTKIGTNL